MTTTPSLEFAAKLDRVRRWLQQEGHQAAELTRYSWVAWLLCGAEARVLAAADRASCSVLVTRDRVVAATNNIEAPRLRDEEAPDLPIEWTVTNWWEAPAEARGVEPPVRLRFSLLEPEVERARRLSRDTGEAIEAAARSLAPGLTEHEIAARMAERAFARGIVPVGLFVAADERAKLYRHPLPGPKRAERNAVLSMVVRRGGLHSSVTRTVSFGPPCDEMLRRHRAVTAVHAAMLGASRPGITLDQVFGVAQRAYADQGFPDEWRHHHQGGPTGYEPREARAAPGSSLTLEANQLVAWNPTIRGSKSEETALVTAQGVELLTRTGEWPAVDGPLPLADILVLCPVIP